MSDETNRPPYDVLAVKEVGRKSYYRKIGVAWPSKDGKGFNIELEALPIGGTVLVREPLPPRDKADADDRPMPDDRQYDEHEHGVAR